MATRRKRRAAENSGSTASNRKQRKVEKIEETEAPIACAEPSSEFGLCSYCACKLLVKIGERDDPDCPSCRLTAEALPINSLEDAKTAMQIAPPALKGNWIYSSTGNRRRYGRLYINQSCDEYPIDIPETINFTTAESWLARCKTEHGKSCDHNNLPLRHSNPIDIILVDVVDYCIMIGKTDSPYFALSYVWGGAVNTTTTTHNFSAFQQPGSLKDHITLPKTVADAMLLTKRLGARYLWVDCLSIIQDSSKKHQDIANMDIIYSQAELTIVACGSEHADSGIPGVREGTRRPRATSATRGKHVVALHLPTSIYGLLEGTTYDTRAWTFQEMVLSKRMLFVTEQQIVFHCGKSRCSESLRGERPSDGQHFGFGNIDLRSERLLEHDTESTLEFYTAMVRVYCSKRLSYQQDIEYAFSGLACVLEQWCGDKPVIHGLMSCYFGYSLCWAIAEDQDYYNFDSAAEIGKRREGFPSWSWVGWAANNTNFCMPTTVYLPLTSFMRDIEITESNTNLVSKSFTVVDRSAREGNETSIGQLVRINWKTAHADSDSKSSSKLSFDAERVSWKEFSVDEWASPEPTFTFHVRGRSLPCGFLSITTDPTIISEVCEETLTADRGDDSTWSLVRLYRIRLQPKKETHIDALQNTLDEMKLSGILESSSAFRRTLKRSNLLFILLIRRRDIYWERMGSGLMIEKYWPSTNPRSKAQIFQERIILI